MIEINVVGLGFVGLTTAVGLSYKNLKINAIEHNIKKLNKIRNLNIPFNEPMLDKKLKYVLKNKKINLTNKIKLNKKKTNVFFICIGTPSNKNGSANLNQISKFLKKIKKIIKNEKILFVIKSTVPPYSIEKNFKYIFSNFKNVNFCSNPEFLQEGSAWKDFFNSGKIVIGHEKIASKLIMSKIYKNFKDKKIFVNNVTAEFIKYLSNSMLANMISFSNDMAILAEKIKNIDIKEAFNSIKLDNRWNGFPSNMSNYFHPGLGYGGYCLPKDIKSLKYFSKKYSKSTILDEIDKINNKIFIHQFKKILKIKKKQNLFVLGLSFKPGTDDLRSSKSIELIKKLIKKKRNVTAFDPLCNESAKVIFGNKIKILKKPFIAKNTTYILSTAWPDYIKFLSKIEKQKIIDLRYVI